MTKTTRKQGDALIVKVEGEIDLYHSSDLKKFLSDQIEDGERNIVIDMSRVVYIDSSAIGAFIASLSLLKSCNGSFKLAEVTPSVYKILQLTKLHSFFSIHKSIEEALS